MPGTAGLYVGAEHRAEGLNPTEILGEAVEQEVAEGHYRSETDLPQLSQSPPLSSFKVYPPCLCAVEGRPTQADIERGLRWR